MPIDIAIVAHPSRHEDATELAGLVNGQLIWDENGHGAEFNHSSALSWLATCTNVLQRTKGQGWVGVLEDDALIREDFLDQLDQVLAVAPTDIVGLYLGTGYPRQWQDILRRRVHPYDEDSHFMVVPEMLNMVGYAVRVGLASSMAAALYARHTTGCADRILTEFCRKRQLQVAYTRPSIVDHRQDMDPVIIERHDGQDRSHKRRAWRYGGRQYWCNSAVAVPAPKPVRVDEAGEWYEIEQGGTFNVE